MTGTRVGILGTGGLGVAAASVLIARGLTSRLTFYGRNAATAQGLALDYLHAGPLLSRVEIRGRGLDELEPEDILVCTVGHHTSPGETRLDVLAQNLAIVRDVATAVEAGGLPRVMLMVTNPLDVLTEYLTRRWEGRPVSVMGSGTALDTLRFTERIAEECGVHPRSVHAWVVGEHGDSCVFLFGSATVGTLPVSEFAAQRGIPFGPEQVAAIERDVRGAAYRVRDLKGSAVHGIGFTVGGLVTALAHETGAIIPVSVRVADGVCASLPCVLGPDGPSAPLFPVMTAEESRAWEHSLAMLREAGASVGL